MKWELTDSRVGSELSLQREQLSVKALRWEEVWFILVPCVQSRQGRKWGRMQLEGRSYILNGLEGHRLGV